MLKQTPLNLAHRAANARLVDFGGWEMPLHYGSQIDEHHRVRRDAGMFDVSHMLAIDLEGADARPFLRKLLANDIDRLKHPGKALYSCMLNDEAGILDDLIVYFREENRFRMVVNAATADKDLDWIDRLRSQVTAALQVEPRRDLCIVAVQGPNARAKFWQAVPETRLASEALGVFSGAASGAWFIARTGYTGEDGFEIMLPADNARQLWDALLAADVAPAGLGARDTLRLEAGMNLYGQDMDESVTPFESGLAWTVVLTDERDFVGKRALLERPARTQMLGLVLTDRGVLRAHQKVHTARGSGEITSGSFSPTLGLSIAIARTPLGVKADEAVRVEVRDRQLTARTVKYPFVRFGKSLIGAVPT